MKDNTLVMIQCHEPVQCVHELLSTWKVSSGKRYICSCVIFANIDIANIQALIDTFTVRGNVNAQDPIYSAGVSNGGNFSSIVAHALNFNAAAMYSAQGNPPALYLVTETPTVFFMFLKKKSKT